MQPRLRNYSLAALAVAAGLGIYSLATSAQSAAPAKQAVATKPTDPPTPRMADGHPDLNGFYNGGGGEGEASTEETPGKNVTNRTADGNVFFDYSGANGGGFAFGTEPPAEANQPPYKPEYMAKVKAVVDKYDYGTTSALDPQQDCKPLGIPRGATGIMQIVQTPKVVAILYEADPGPYYRVIYMDGKHPSDLDTSYMGHSIGHWEGDTLVVDVVGLNDETWLGGGFTGPRYGNMHSDKEHVVERWSRKGNQLTYEATVEDPVMFTRPWVITPRHARIAAADDYIQPQMCVNNDKPHFIQPSEADHYQCDFCQKNADGVYGQGASADDKARADELDKQYGDVLRSAPGNEGLRRPNSGQ
jgi:hypothetical protein